MEGKRKVKGSESEKVLPCQFWRAGEGAKSQQAQEALRAGQVRKQIPPEPLDQHAPAATSILTQQDPPQASGLQNCERRNACF